MASLFEWEEGKREANLIKHGVDFIDSLDVFTDARRVERIDTRRPYGEERWQCIGRAKNPLLFVVYTVHGAVRRLISARKASRLEREAYDAGGRRTGW